MAPLALPGTTALILSVFTLPTATPYLVKVKKILQICGQMDFHEIFLKFSWRFHPGFFFQICSNCWCFVFIFRILIYSLWDSSDISLRQWFKLWPAVHTGRNCFNLFQLLFSASTADAHPGVSGVSKDQKICEKFKNTHCQVNHPAIME